MTFSKISLEVNYLITASQIIGSYPSIHPSSWVSGRTVVRLMHGEVLIEPPNEELLQGVDRTTVQPQLVFGGGSTLHLLFLRNNSVQLVLSLV